MDITNCQKKKKNGEEQVFFRILLSIAKEAYEGGKTEQSTQDVFSPRNVRNSFRMQRVGSEEQGDNDSKLTIIKKVLAKKIRKDTKKRVIKNVGNMIPDGAFTKKGGIEIKRGQPNGAPKFPGIRSEVGEELRKGF